MRLTLFTIPKPFIDPHISKIQFNAIRSWIALKQYGNVEIIVFGDDEGVAGACEQLDVRHVPRVEKTALGTPLLSSVFAQVYEIAQHEILCYANADIIFFQDILETTDCIPFQNFMAVGQRINVDLTKDLDFTSQASTQFNKKSLAEIGELAPKAANDYFIFSKNLIQKPTLPLAVGRPQWDTWFIYHAVRSGFEIVDTTNSITAIHQNHGYQHVPNGRGNSWRGEEGDENIRLVQKDLYRRTTFTMKDATWVTKNGKLRRAVGLSYLISTLNHLDFQHRWLMPLYVQLRKINIWTVHVQKGRRRK